MIATRLNKALKTEQDEFYKLCLVLFIICGLLIFGGAPIITVLLIAHCGIIVWNMYVEYNRIFTCGNKYKSLLVLYYLAGKSNSYEISDQIAEEFNNLDHDSRQKICFKLDIILLLMYSLPIIFIYFGYYIK